MEKDKVQHILEELLQMLSVQFRSIECHDVYAHPMYHIATDDAPMLIGVGGENLKALNYIAKKIIEKKLGTEHTHFILDVNGYQRKRLDALAQQAQMLADRARTFKSDVAMQPLNAYERMIVHSLFANDPDVTTESAGEGKQRHIVFHCASSLARADTNDSLLIE